MHVSILLVIGLPWRDWLVRSEMIDWRHGVIRAINHFKSLHAHFFPRFRTRTPILMKSSSFLRMSKTHIMSSRLDSLVSDIHMWSARFLLGINITWKISSASCGCYWCRNTIVSGTNPPFDLTLGVFLGRPTYHSIWVKWSLEGWPNNYH